MSKMDQGINMGFLSFPNHLGSDHSDEKCLDDHGWMAKFGGRIVFSVSGLLGWRKVASSCTIAQCERIVTIVET